MGLPSLRRSRRALHSVITLVAGVAAGILLGVCAPFALRHIRAPAMAPAAMSKQPLDTFPRRSFGFLDAPSGGPASVMAVPGVAADQHAGGDVIVGAGDAEEDVRRFVGEEAFALLEGSALNEDFFGGASSVVAGGGGGGDGNDGAGESRRFGRHLLGAKVAPSIDRFGIRTITADVLGYMQGNASFTVIHYGSGDGTVSLQLAERFPNSMVFSVAFMSQVLTRRHEMRLAKTAFTNNQLVHPTLRMSDWHEAPVKFASQPRFFDALVGVPEFASVQVFNYFRVWRDSDSRDEVKRSVGQTLAMGHITYLVLPKALGERAWVRAAAALVGLEVEVEQLVYTVVSETKVRLLRAVVTKMSRKVREVAGKRCEFGFEFTAPPTRSSNNGGGGGGGGGDKAEATVERESWGALPPPRAGVLSEIDHVKCKLLGRPKPAHGDWKKSREVRPDVGVSVATILALGPSRVTQMSLFSVLLDYTGPPMRNVNSRWDKIMCCQGGLFVGVDGALDLHRPHCNLDIRKIEGKRHVVGYDPKGVSVIPDGLFAKDFNNENSPKLYTPERFQVITHELMSCYTDGEAGQWFHNKELAYTDFCLDLPYLQFGISCFQQHMMKLLVSRDEL